VDTLQGDTVNELIVNQTLLLIKRYTWMARAVYKCSSQDPEAAYSLISASTVGRLQLEIR
jgi:hypothetical protein